MTGHAWQHSDAHLIGIVIRGTMNDTGPGGMPAFAGRLDEGEIGAVLAYVKSRWPASVRTHQSALNSGVDQALAALLRDPGSTLPRNCLPSAFEATER